jgi:hypothetical protein
MREKWMACLLAAALPLAGTGCFGSFNLTRKIYDVNREVSPEKWVREIVFLAFAIMPVYGLAMLIDAIVFNTVEFWTGENPMLVHDGDRQTIETAQGRATLTRLGASALEVELRSADGKERRFVLVREPAGFAARELDGALIARAGDTPRLPAAQGVVASAWRTSSAVPR